ncbi:MAG: dihydrolipoyl dehydrogenase [Synergistales bacterium]|nr:dihydrolipoyl dehydrogenase [Synergistales bacterium]
MSTNVTMPKLGLTMNEGTVTEWRRNQGDRVAKGEIILVVATDKLTYEVEAPDGGILARIDVQAGETVPVGAPLAVIAAPDEAVETGTQGASQSGDDPRATAPGPETAGEPAPERRKRLVVIGGGPGGYVAAIRAAQLGAQVTLVERRWLGGTCLNVGCIPTKVLLHTVELLEAVKGGKKLGLRVEGAEVDWKGLMKQKKRVVSRLVGGVGSLLKANGVSVAEGVARFVDAHTISVAGADGEETITADGVIVAAGSSPAVPPIPGLDSVAHLTSEEALSLEEPPASLAVIGGGVIGVEFASIYAGLGTRVTVVEMLPEILPGMDPELVQVVRRALSRKGVRFHTGAAVRRAGDGGEGVTLAVEAGGETLELTAERLLVAAGRRPVTEGLGLEAIGAAVEKGFVRTDGRCATTVPGVYAVGDCANPLMLAHVASAEGEAAAENALGGDAVVDMRTAPACLYTSPEVASVGLTEEQAREQGYDVKVGRFPLTACGKAVVMDDTAGLVKFVVDAAGDEVLGVHMAGPRATDLITEAALALRLEATADEIIETIHAHPTLGEAVREAALDVRGAAVHIPPAKR